MSGEMAVAYIHTHVPRGPWPLTNRGELALVYCFLLLYLAFAGGGAYGLDRLLRAVKTGAVKTGAVKTGTVKTGQ
jgi:putative oxidoreductase